MIENFSLTREAIKKPQPRKPVSVSFDDGIIAVLADDHTMWLSIDFGHSWKQLAPLPNTEATNGRIL